MFVFFYLVSFILTPIVGFSDVVGGFVGSVGCVGITDLENIISSLLTVGRLLCLPTDPEVYANIVVIDA